MPEARVLEPDLGAQLVEAILDRAAAQLGDITPHVMERYYAATPHARERFEFHSPGRPARLEGEMIEQALYCLMRWHSDRGEIEIVLATTVPHHLHALGIAVALFTGLIDAVCETVAATIPANQADEMRCWNEMRRTMKEFMIENA